MADYVDGEDEEEENFHKLDKNPCSCYAVFIDQSSQARPIIVK
jgi:hypothetical protein